MQGLGVSGDLVTCPLIRLPLLLCLAAPAYAQSLQERLLQAEDARATTAEGLATLKVFVLMGGLELRVPPDWTVIVNGLPLLGGIDNRTVPPAIPGKRLEIDGICALGGVEVRN